MIGPLLAALLALPASAATPAADVEKAFTRIAALLASQRGRHAGDIDSLDKTALAEGEALRRHGWRAVEPLAAVATDLKRPMKVRLFAASFLARTGDPSPRGRSGKSCSTRNRTRSCAARPPKASPPCPSRARPPAAS